MAQAEISKVITVDKAIPVDIDIGLLAAFDINPFSSNNEDNLRAIARDGTQLLLNAILSCPIQTSSEGVLITLPEPITPLPRAKPVPIDTGDSKWAKFAKLKGIQGKKREGKMVFDEEKEDWVPKWGYKGQNKDAEEAWAVEIDDKKTTDAEDPRSTLRASRKAKGSSNAQKSSTNTLRDTKPKLKALIRSGKAGKVIKRTRRH